MNKVYEFNRSSRLPVVCPGGEGKRNVLREQYFRPNRWPFTPDSRFSIGETYNNRGSLWSSCP